MVAIAGWMNRRQQEAIKYLKVENRILREKLGHKRIILNVSQKQQQLVRYRLGHGGESLKYPVPFACDRSCS